MGLRSRRLPLLLAALGYALAFAQRPGEVVADTKVHLYVDPARFLHDVLSVWSPTADLGHVWGGQYNGYLFPMAPWFALGDALGIPVWVVHRLWLGTLLALAAWGVVLLVDALVRRERGVVHAAAAVLFVVNPYVAVYANRTSVALLAYAALPWMLVVVHRGLGEPRAWRWPAAFALVLALTGGGVNAAVTGWVLVGPLLLVVYELAWAGRGLRRDVLPWLWRTALCAAVANAWWVVPLLVHARHGLDFLPFTEQPGTIWGTSSLPEVLRLMGFWTSYVGVGYGGRLLPFAGQGVFLFNTGVVLATLLVPALVLASLRWTRTRGPAPFFALLVLAGLLIMAAGWPEGTPLRRGLTFVYNHVDAVRFLRTTYKAGPLTALGLAVLGGLGLAALLARLPARPLRVAAGVAAATLVAVAAWPLVTGRALERQLQFDLPPAWREQAAALDRTPASRSRAWLVPGQLFAFSTWGGTIDDVLPALTDRPVAARYIVPFADLRSVDLQWGTDALLTQERLVPGQLRPLLELQGVGDLVTAADRDRARGGNLGTAETVRALAAQGLGGGRGLGPVRPAPAAAGRIAPPVRVPQLRDRPLLGRTLAVLPRGPLTVADGGAAALTGLAAFGALGLRTPYAYAPDLTPAQIRRAAEEGGTLVIADGNRRQAFVAARQRGDRGAVLRADQAVSEDGTMLDPFPAAGTAAQTIALAGGVRVDAPSSPQVTQFPEHRAFAAVDGDPATAWLADRVLPTDRHHLDVTFPRPRDVAVVDLLPYSDSRGVVTAVRVGGRRFAVHRGWNRLRVGLRQVRTLRVAIAGVRRPREASAGAGGIRELRIAGLRATETLRTPVLLSRALRDADLSQARIVVLLSRFTAADPYHRARLTGPQQAGLVRDARDPEAQLSRVVALPGDARRYRLDAWARPAEDAGDALLDRLAGTTGPVAARSSSRYDGLPRHRASGAFDGGRRAWVGQWIAGRPAWISWALPQPRTLRRLRLVAPGVVVRRPTRVRLTVDGRRTPVLPVAADGLVTLPAPLRGRRVRLDVVAAAFPPRTPGRLRQRRAVGIGEIRAAGLPRLRVPRRGLLRLPCGSAALTFDGRTVTLGGTVRRAAFDAGRPLRLHGCGARPALSGTVRVAGRAAPLVVDQLRLDGIAPGGLTVVSAGGGGTVARDGTLDGDGLTDAAVRASGPSWLVFGQSFAEGWRARCDGRDLGRPVPLQGYANAWRLDAPGCRDLDVTYGPQRLVRLALLLSLVAAPLLLGVLLAGSLRRRERPSYRPLEGVGRTVDAPAPWPLRRALAAGALLGALTGFLLALRAGVVIGPLVALVLWRGIGDRVLLTLSAVLLVVAVPLAYLLADPTDHGGYDTAYATQHIAAHWLAVGGLVLLAFVLGRQLSTARGRAARARG